MSYALTIAAGPNGAQGTGTNGPYLVLFDENIGDATVIGEITGFDSTPSNVTFHTNSSGVLQNMGGRYSIISQIDGGGVKHWYLVVTGGMGGAASANFNYEGTRNHTIWIDALDGSGGLIGEGNYTVTMRNLNEAPTTINFGAQATITAGQAPTDPNVIKATWAGDPDTPTNFRTNGYGFLLSNGNVVTTDGGFSIDANGQITTNANFATAEVAGIRSLQVVTYVINNGVPDTTVRTVVQKDITISAVQTTPPSFTATTTTVPAESTGTTYATPFNGNLSVSYGNDTDQLTVEVTFATANGAMQNGTDVGSGGSRLYTFTGTKSAVNTWLAGLQFNPTDSYTGTGQNTNFTVTVKPQGASAWSATSTAITVAADINDNAAITAGEVDQAVSVGSAINPFDGIALTDEENDDITLTVTFAAGGGTWGGLTSTGGVTVTNNSGTGSITFVGKAALVTAFLDNVTFTATAAGTKTFSYTVVDQHTAAGQHTTAVSGTPFTVTATNNPPTILAPTIVGSGSNGTGADAGKIVFNEDAGAVQIFDVDATDTDGTIASYAISGTYPAGAFSIDANGTVSVNTAALGNTTADRPFTLTITATDNGGATGTRTVDVVVKNNVVDNDAPVLGNVPAGPTTVTTITDLQTTKPFETVTITDDSASVTVLVWLDDPSEGALAGTGFAWDNALNAYKFVGSPTNAQAAIQSLVFTPQARPNAAVGAEQSTTFTISVSDGQLATVNSNIIVKATAANRAPVLVADAVTKTIAHDQNVTLVNPFSAVGITETNANDDVTLTITLDDDAKGVLSNLSGFTYDTNNHWYTFTGNAVAAQAAIQALRYNPRDRAGTTVSETTTFTITVKDEQNATVTSSNIKVESTPTVVPNNAPTGLSLSNASVLEYTLPGAEIGTFNATDANNDALTYSLLDNAGGRFAITGNKLVLAGPGVNFEEAASHQIKVQVSDGHGGVIDQVFTIGVGDQLTLNKRGTKKLDKMSGSTFDDILKGGPGNVKDVIKGLAGDDKLYGEGGNDSILGGDGIDSLYGGKGNDTLKGEAGKDLLKGEAGDDKMYGGLGNDVLYGGAGNDLLKGDADDDVLYGDAGDDKMYGGLGNDKLYGGAGNDFLKGDAGDDVLYGDAGNDKLYGGAGNDTFVFNKKTNKDTNFDQIFDFKSGQDKLFLDNAVFKKLGTTGTFDAPVKLDATMFTTNKAKDKNDYLVYKGGVLYYDANGSGKGGEVEIVKIKGLKAADIWII
ncbi:hypothetical protein AB4072_08265 [Microvirga sp. 2MCAF38]|uniref:hypothetical protein n=1 Tax=Microvirga sp. 2MCAF38 TaxID=3232989 RepID=UPI003F9AAA2A